MSTAKSRAHPVGVSSAEFLDTPGMAFYSRLRVRKGSRTTEHTHYDASTTYSISIDQQKDNNFLVGISGISYSSGRSVPQISEDSLRSRSSEIKRVLLGAELSDLTEL